MSRTSWFTATRERALSRLRLDFWLRPANSFGGSGGGDDQGEDEDDVCCFIDVQEDYDATGDGSTDDRLAIQRAIDAAHAAGGGTVYFRPGTYMVSRNASFGYCLLLKSGVRLVGASRRAVTIKQVGGIASSIRMFYATSAVDAAICDMTLDGNKASQTVNEHRHGIFADGCTRLLLERVNSQNFTGDGFYLYIGATDTILRDCYATANDRNGITFGADLTGVTLMSSVFSGNAVQQVDSEPGSGNIVEDVRILGCTIDGAGVSSDYVLTISGTGSLERGRGWTVVGNVIRGSVFVVWCDDVVIEGNLIETPVAKPAIAVYRACNRILIHGNVLACTSTTESSEAVVRVEATGVGQQPDFVTISDNTIRVAYSTNAGVLVRGALRISIENNHLYGVGTGGSSWGGILLRSNVATRSMTARGNTVQNFGSFGVKVYSDTGAFCEAVDISHNTFDDTQGSPTMTTGIQLDPSGTNVAKKLTVIGNQCFGGVSTPISDYPTTTPILIGGTRGARGIYSVTGTPEAALTEVVGAIAMRRDGGGTTTLYVKESGSGSTGWVAK